MNKKQLEVEKAKLTAEEKELNHLKAIYKKAAEDVSNKIAIHDETINVLLKDYDNLDDVQKSILQSKIYQKKFQESLKKQLDGFLADLNSGQYKSIDEYLNTCYETGFLGSMYDIHGQGIPIITPIDQKKVVKAKDIDSKISKKLYTRMGEDVDLLKKRIANNISRGIATADSFANIARNISSASNVGFNNAMRIARTEGHRIQAAAAFDAQHKAKDAGADIVKQWNSALDGRTRDTHRLLDGQIRELDEPFEVYGHKARFPSDFGMPSEDINCRCALLQRAKWALDDEELQVLKDRAAYYGLDKTESFQDFQKKYLKAAEEIKSMPDSFVPAKTIEEAKKYANDKLGLFRVDYDKMQLEFANMLNKEVTRVYNTFGNLNSKGRLEAIIIWPKKVSWYAAYSSNSKLIGLKNVTSKGTLKKWAKDAGEMFTRGFWSTSSAEHAIRHELGHAVQDMVQAENLGKINRIELLHNRLMQELGISKWTNPAPSEDMKKAGKYISYYGLRNEGELIAESVAEYMAGNPRPVAKKVVEILTSESMNFDLDEIMREIL